MDSKNYTKEIEVGVKEVPQSHSSSSSLSGDPPARPLSEVLKRWPQTPQTTTFDTRYEIFLNFFDVVLVFLPIVLCVKAGLCLYAEHVDQSNTGPSIDAASLLSRKLVDFNGQLSTISTVVFLLIMATFFRRFALWKAERGANLAELEVLQASVSPISTIKVMFSLRAFSLTTIGFASIWVWYYASSQAAQREYSLQQSSAPGKFEIATLSPAALSPFEDGTWHDYSAIEKTDMTSIFHVYSQKTKGDKVNTRSDGLDVVENALPLMYNVESLSQSLKQDRDGWWPVKDITNDWSVASSIGVVTFNNLASFGSYGDGTTWTNNRLSGEFEYDAKYLDVNCTTPRLSVQKAPDGLLSTMTMSYNLTAKSTNPRDPRLLDFWNHYNTTHSITSQCSMYRIDTSMRVRCDTGTCKVVAIKQRPGFEDPNPRTTLFDDDVIGREFIDALLYACGRPQSISDLSTFEVDNGLQDYILMIDILDSVPAEHPQESVSSLTSLSESTTRYFNTFLQASTWMKYNHDGNQDIHSWGNSTILKNDTSWQIQNASMAFFQPHYSCSKQWVAVDITSNLVLLAAALAAFWLRKHTHAPDIFGYVSSLTRENARLDVPGGSALHGLERTRKMKHVQVKLAEVPSGFDHGKIGLTYVGNDVAGTRDLEKGRRYI